MLRMRVMRWAVGECGAKVEYAFVLIKVVVKKVHDDGDKNDDAVVQGRQTFLCVSVMYDDH